MITFIEMAQIMSLVAVWCEAPLNLNKSDVNLYAKQHCKNEAIKCLDKEATGVSGLTPKSLFKCLGPK